MSLSLTTRLIIIAAASENPHGISYHTHKDLTEDATKAGFNDVRKYISDLLTPARLYQECIADPGPESTLCRHYKEFWLECKAAHNGNKVAWNEEEIHKMIKEDAAKAGYKDGYCYKKDPKHLKSNACLYEECVAKHGAAYSWCNEYKKIYLECKVAQNGNKVTWNEAEVHKMIKEDAAKSVYHLY